MFQLLTPVSHTNPVKSQEPKFPIPVGEDQVQLGQALEKFFTELLVYIVKHSAVTFQVRPQGLPEFSRRDAISTFIIRPAHRPQLAFVELRVEVKNRATRGTRKKGLALVRQKPNGSQGGFASVITLFQAAPTVTWPIVERAISPTPWYDLLTILIG